MKVYAVYVRNALREYALDQLYETSELAQQAIDSGEWDRYRLKPRIVVHTVIAEENANGNSG